LGRQEEELVGKTTFRTYEIAVKGHFPHDLERLMRAARPAPRPGFVAELERSLRTSTAKRRRRVPPVLVAGAAFAVVLAALVIAMSFSGVLPFTSGGSPARAGEDCRNVVIHPTERRAYFVRVDGEWQVRYRNEVVRRVVKRCR
jgi:hypothetical protein